jgi:prepilin-type N-terminal cleavage/methylation domain-containing protein
MSRPRTPRSPRSATLGFSIIELMIALAISALGIAAASQMAGSAVRSARRGTETADLATRARLLGRQIRLDLRLAGVGSTGAIGVDSTVAPWNTNGGQGLVWFPSDGTGYAAIPAIRGTNNIASGQTVTTVEGSATPLAGSDALTIVVPDPSRSAHTTALSPRDSLQLFLDTVPACQPNEFIYIADHSAANAAGRTQITNWAVAGPVVQTDRLQFDIPPSSEVMCARISTYWVGSLPTTAGGVPGVNWLFRTELGSQAPGGGAGAVNVINGAGGLPALIGGNSIGLDAPAIEDFQVAYRFSSFAVGAAATPDQRWAFAANSGYAAPPGTNWFEVRQVRFNLMVSAVRGVEDAVAGVDAVIQEQRAEDGQGTLALMRARGRFQFASGETLMSIRFYDKNLPSTVAAEPY